MIGTTSTEAKAAKAREAGADEVILYSQKDFVEEVNRITEGKGVNAIYDGVGKTTFLKSKQIVISLRSPSHYSQYTAAICRPVAMDCIYNTCRSVHHFSPFNNVLKTLCKYNVCMRIG